MVLELRQQDAVARLQKGSVGICHEVDGRGAATGEDNLHRLHTQEPCDLFTRGLVALGRTLCQAVHTAQHIGAGSRLVGAHRLQHRQRRLRRSAIVEVVERLAVNDLRKNGKLTADRGDVETHAGPRARHAANASGVSMSVIAASPVISTSQTKSACSPMRCLAPVSPETWAISAKKRRSHSTGLPRLPPTVGTQIERPSTGLNAAIRRSSSIELTPGMSPSCTIAASMSLPRAPMPVRTEVLRPSAKSGLVTKRSLAVLPMPCSTAAFTWSAMWPSTTTISTACEASAAFAACTTSGAPPASCSSLLGPPMRVER